MKSEMIANAAAIFVPSAVSELEMAQLDIAELRRKGADAAMLDQLSGRIDALLDQMKTLNRLASDSGAVSE